MRSAQGKCVPCKVRVVWRGRPLVRRAYCPGCGTKLERTAHYLKWPTVERRPLDGAAAAVALRVGKGGADRLHWRNEFGDAYAVPPEVELLVLDGKLEDTSWHNDAAPSFEREVNDAGAAWDVRLWVDHPEPAEREATGGKRFFVTTSPKDECDPCHELLETEKLDEALALVDGGPVADNWVRERIADAERRGRIPRADFTDRAGLKAWCEALNAARLLFHFDDDPAEVVHTEPGYGSVRTFTDAEAAYLRDVAVPLVRKVAERDGFDPFEECEAR